jgi:GT2 family glycosyltransferase
MRAGVAGARNFGASKANGEIIVFADAHVDLAEGWLRPLCEALAVPAVAAAGPAVARIERRRDTGYGFTWGNPALRPRWLRAKPGKAFAVPFICGCFLAVRRPDFEATGGFDAGMSTWGSEDAEFCLHLWRRGRECCIVPESEVFHLFRRSFPYRVNAQETLHNALRLGVVHLDADSFARMVDYVAGNSLPGAIQQLVDSDAFDRREVVQATSLYDGRWFIDRFKIEALR